MEINKNKIKISVIMGVYNSNTQKLKQALVSILNQTFSSFELIICDDGSTNNTYKFLEMYSKKDSRIVLLKNSKNEGLANALNRCIHMSKGDFIARMDDDDRCKLDRLEKQYVFLKKNSQYTLVGSQAYLFQNKQIYNIKKVPEKPTRRDFLYNSPFIHPSIMIRREAIIKLGGYSTAKTYLRLEDYELFMRLYQKGFIGYNVQIPLIYYREDAESFKKRKYRFRIHEVHLRWRGFHSLKLMPLALPFVLKPFVAGLIPRSILYKTQIKISSKHMELI